jgi:hypothetical protein
VGHDSLKKTDSDFRLRYDPDTEISTWCHLHVLAKKFYIEDLADACLKGYGKCRKPFWQGSWLPLPAEVRFAYNMQHPGQHTSSLKAFLVDYMTKQLFSSNQPVKYADIAELLRVHQQFTVQVLRAHNAHMNMGPWDWAPKGCDVNDCRLHPQWIDPNLGFIQVPLSCDGQFGGNDSATEVHEIRIKTDQDVASLLDDEEALADAEMEEALAEADEMKERLFKEEEQKGQVNGLTEALATRLECQEHEGRNP